MSSILSKKNYRTLFSTSIIITLIVILIIILRSYVSAFLGSVILFILFLPLYKLFRYKYKLSKNISAVSVLIISFLILIIPLIIIFYTLSGEVNTIITSNFSAIQNLILNSSIIPNSLITNNIASISNVIRSTLLYLFKSTANILLGLLISYFCFYYLLVNENSLIQIAEKHLPFKKKNRNELVEKFEKVTYATVFATGLVAIIQGIVISIIFLIAGIPNAIFWGFIGAILSFLPIIGISLIWLPTSLFYIFLQQNLAIGFFVLIAGMLTSGSDYLLRPYFQKKYGQLHPLISILGIFIGIKYFGFAGIVVGPLFLSYILMLFRILENELTE